MGFLTCNRSKRSLRSLKSPRPAKKGRIEPVRKVGIESLPVELLEVILVQSSNFSLPQASPTLAQRLRKNPLLEEYMLRGQILETGQFPIQATAWPFVTKQLLERIGITEFDSPHIPASVQAKLTPASLDLLIYLVRCGCIPNDADPLYFKLLKSGRVADVELLISRNIACKQGAAIQAMELNYHDLAAKLVEAAGAHNLTFADAEELWAYASQTENKTILNRLMEIETLHSNSI